VLGVEAIQKVEKIMDVLQLVKEDHNKFRAMCSGLESLDLKALALKIKDLGRIWSRIVAVENEILFPELEASYSRVRDVLKSCEGRTKALVDGFKVSFKVPPSERVNNISELLPRVHGYLGEKEERLMPLFRKHLTTENREDLALLYSDTVEAMSSKVFAGAAVSTKEAKRA
jgi:hypothetical protein